MVVSSYQMNESCRSSEYTDSPCCAAYQATLSFFEVFQRSPTDHCAMPRPGPPPDWAMVGDMPDS